VVMSKRLKKGVLEGQLLEVVRFGQVQKAQPVVERQGEESRRKEEGCKESGAAESSTQTAPW